MTSRRDTWLPAPTDVRLRGDEVHVWRASLDHDPSEFEEFFATLTEDERERASRFRFERGREVGVDVELLRDDIASVEVARRFFSAAEG